MRNQRDKDVLTKQEGAPPTSSRIWSGLKNPRIVRVSRAFGGKDRHSKVTTVRGLRDRRVRLSVPTAIQLYDLQERLGLNQPSKVVDWLLNAARHEIDKLPPLQIPDGFVQFPSDVPQPHSTAQTTNESPSREKGNAPVSSFNTVPYASYYQWEAANAYLSQIGLRSSQSTEFDPQIVFCPPGMMTPMFQSNVLATPIDHFAPKQFGQLQTQQSNLEMSSLHLGSNPSARPFQ